VSLSLDALVGKRFFARLARHLDRLLSLHGATLTLTIDRVPAREARDVERLLARLARHGDRIFVRLHRSLHERVRIDSSRFNLVLTGVAP
jgi:non-ribosomal peptide synthetase component F